MRKKITNYEVEFNDNDEAGFRIGTVYKINPSYDYSYISIQRIKRYLNEDIELYDTIHDLRGTEPLWVDDKPIIIEKGKIDEFKAILETKDSDAIADYLCKNQSNDKSELVEVIEIQNASGKKEVMELQTFDKELFSTEKPASIDYRDLEQDPFLKEFNINFVKDSEGNIYAKLQSDKLDYNIILDEDYVKQRILDNKIFLEMEKSDDKKELDIEDNSNDSHSHSFEVEEEETEHENKAKEPWELDIDWY